MPMLGRRGKLRDARALRSQIEEALVRLNASPNLYTKIELPVHFWFTRDLGAYRLYRRPGLLSFYLSSNTRPPTFVLMGLDTASSKILLPTVDVEDFARMVQLLELNDISEVVYFSLMLRPVAFTVSVPPVRINNSADAGRCGFEFTPAMDESISTHTTLWWVKLGGRVFTFTFDPLASPPLCKQRQIASGVGDYKRIGPIR